MPEDNSLWRKFARSTPDADCRRISGANLLARNCTVNAGQLALVVGTLEFMDKCQADNVIARFSSLYSMALYAAVPIGCSWQGQISYWNYQELIAYGLQLVRQYSVESKPLYLYHYGVYDYKLIPDWLKSKYWARPYRWNKSKG